MKLVHNKLGGDTITTDDGIIIGIIHYTPSIINDAGQTGRRLFHEFWAGVGGEFTIKSNSPPPLLQNEAKEE